MLTNAQGYIEMQTSEKSKYFS